MEGASIATLRAKTQDLSDNWKTSTIGERIHQEGADLKDIKDLSPETIRLSYDFSIALQQRDNQTAMEILSKIENLSTIWRHEI